MLGVSCKKRKMFFRKVNEYILKRLTDSPETLIVHDKCCDVAVTLGGKCLKFPVATP